MKEMVPNTTPTPNVIIDEWMPILKDVEFRVVVVVTRQTLGWVEDPETGRRKAHDWISHSQLIKKTGRGSRAISEALKVVADHYGLLEAVNNRGEPLDTPNKRRKGGQIYYRLNLHSPPPTLFSPISTELVPRRRGQPVDKLGNKQLTIANFAVVPSQILHTTKETNYKNIQQGEERPKSWG